MLRHGLVVNQSPVGYCEMMTHNFITSRQVHVYNHASQTYPQIYCCGTSRYVVDVSANSLSVKLTLDGFSVDI